MEKFFFDSSKGKINLEIPDSVYFPQEDSLLLAQEIEKLGKSLEDVRFLEIGCGSGFLSILAAKLGASVTATDINPEAVETTIQNAKANSISLNAFCSDLFANVKGSFDFIIFNAPYLPDQDSGIAGKEQWSIHQNGNIIERFISECRSHLNSRGKILLLFSSLSGDIIKLLEENGFEAKILKKEKIEWEELIVVETTFR